MPPKVILIRHGQATHNDWSLHDPGLTEKGIDQSKLLVSGLRGMFPFTKHNTLIVVSPLLRTIQTFQHGLAWLVEEGVPVEFRAEWQETTGNPCDIGTDVRILSERFPELDFSCVDPVYPSKTGIYDPDEEPLLRRAASVRKWLFDRPEEYVVVVTHSGFLRRVMDDTKYKNVEFRLYEFGSPERDKEEKTGFQLQDLNVCWSPDGLPKTRE